MAIVIAWLGLSIVGPPAPAGGASAPGPAGLAAVDTARISHVAWLDRRPLCPVDDQPFGVRLTTRAGNVSQVRVRFLDGPGAWVNASLAATLGPNDVWEAPLPASTQPVVSYYFELSATGSTVYLGPLGVSAAPPPDSGWAVDFATLAHAPLGATPVTGGVVFKVWAPTSATAWVRGEFDNWGLANPMTKVGDDFVRRVPGAYAGQEYKFYFDGATWNVDLRARIQDPAGGYNNSMVADPLAYTWSSNAFVTPPIDRMVIYQLNVGTFAGLNDPVGASAFPSRFSDVALRVDHLAELGVNAVLLNPVTSSPNLTFAGYECISPWAPNWSYGRPDELKALVDACHARGIAVLCDIVWNHIAPAANFLWNYNGTQIYFEPPYNVTPWGDQASFHLRGTADFYAQSAQAWLEEYRLDGYRMDAVAYMAVGAHPEGGWSLMQRFNDDIDRRWPDKLAIAEQFPMSGPLVQPTSVGGAGFDCQYDGGFRSDLRWAIQSGVTGTPWVYSLSSALRLNPGTSTGHQAFRYFELHDDAWTPNHRFVRDLQRTPGVLDDSAQARMRLVTGALLLAPGIPALLMGDEWLETADWGTGSANRIDWSRRLTYAAYGRWMRELLRQRTHTPAFFADASCLVTRVDATSGVVAWTRHDADGQTYLAVANLGSTSYESYVLGAPLPGTWVEVLNSQASEFGGWGQPNGARTTTYAFYDGYPNALSLRLPALGLVVMRALPPLDAPAVGPRAGDQLDPVVPNPSRGGAALNFALGAPGHVRLEVFDTGGRRVTTLVDGVRPAGSHTARWDGRDGMGRAVLPGVYFVRLDSRAGVRTRRIALVR